MLPTWQANANAEREKTGKQTGEHQNRLQTWWLLKRPREQMLSAILPLPRFIVCARVTKRPIFEFLSSAIRPDSSLTVFAFADDYSFGILQSGIHWAWFKARCSTLKGDFRYTSDTVFDTFPWPQFEPAAALPPGSSPNAALSKPTPTTTPPGSIPKAAPRGSIPKGLRLKAQGCEERATLGNPAQNPANPEGGVAPSPHSAPPAAPNPSAGGGSDHQLSTKNYQLIAAVATAAVALRSLRREIMAANGWSLRELYRTLETPGANRLRDAHAALDAAVRAAYGMKPDEDPLAFLLRLNLELAEKESKGGTVTPPGLPAAIQQAEEFRTADCIEPA